jgi:hypothetical protein
VAAVSPELLAATPKPWPIKQSRTRRRTKHGRVDLAWTIFRWAHGGKTYDDKPPNPRYSGLANADRPKVTAEVA